MIKATKVEEKLIYYCGDCGQKLDRVEISGGFVGDAMFIHLELDRVVHVVLRCPVCFTLSSVRAEDCGN